MKRLTRVCSAMFLATALLVSAGADTDRRPLHLTFAGDIMQHDDNAAMPDYNRIYDSVRPILQSDDLSFANLEFPVDPTVAAAGYPIFNGSIDYVEAAILGGFDVFSTANNHSFDLGARGVLATRDVSGTFRQSHGVHSNGIKATEGGPVQITEIQVRDWRIGFVAVTSFSNVGGALPYINLIDMTKTEAAASFLDQVAVWDREFDLLVVSVHAGVEYRRVPDAAKARFFRDLVANGADIVWGHHPHVLQPWETVMHRGAAKIIMHSTGNFISAQRRLQQPFLSAGRWAPTGDAALFRITVSGSEPAVASVQTHLFSIIRHPEHGLVPQSFGEILTKPLPVEWRSFYLVRYAETRALLDNRWTGFAYRRIQPDQQLIAFR